ncbi:copper transporter [Nocardioides sp. URHA0020]|uniref:copper transporter n=1 Tax=Nocardioides sp. URHA0020 TaxID=1380392 RepID=UPI00049183EE|nr:copper transporter [Nocardioides sp. URHA0020]
MISYRHHIVSLVAVFLALAVGVVLGGGPLTDLGRDDRPASAATSTSPERPRGADFGDTFAAASAKRLYADHLATHQVAVVAMPGADADTAAALVAQVGAAGGKVSGTYAVRAALTDPGQKSLVDTLGSQLMTQLGDAIDPDAPTYERLGQLLGLAVAGTGSDVETVRESLAGAELVGTSKDATTGDVVLVVLGDHTDPAILSGVSTGLATSTGVVVVGTTRSGRGSGDLVALRADPAAKAVGTVDGGETTLGQVTATLALIRSLSKPGGAFGASGSAGAVPLT